jgi:hypothetical protein
VTGRLLGYLLPAVLVVLTLAAAFGQQGELTVEIVSKRYSSGYFPVVGSYVEYEVRMINTGNIEVKNVSLLVSLVSDGGRTNSSAAYFVAYIGPGESKTLHLGPFKVEQEGGHRLLARLDGAGLDYSSDSFAVYRPEAIQAGLVAIPVIAAGAGLVGFSLYRKRKVV